MQWFLSLTIIIVTWNGKRISLTHCKLFHLNVVMGLLRAVSLTILNPDLHNNWSISIPFVDVTTLLERG